MALRSGDPYDAPKLDIGYLTDSEGADLATLRCGPSLHACNARSAQCLCKVCVDQQGWYAADFVGQGLNAHSIQIVLLGSQAACLPLSPNSPSWLQKPK